MYLILCLALPNSLQIEPEVRKSKHSLQTCGFVIAAILSWLIVFVLYLIAEDTVRRDSYGFFIVGLLFLGSFLVIPVGGIVGFFIGRVIAERRL